MKIGIKFVKGLTIVMGIFMCSIFYWVYTWQRSYTKENKEWRLTLKKGDSVLIRQSTIYGTVDTVKDEVVLIVKIKIDKAFKPR